MDHELLSTSVVLFSTRQMFIDLMIVEKNDVFRIAPAAVQSNLLFAVE